MDTHRTGQPIHYVLLLAMAAIHVALHVFTQGRYGIFRDEFYYLACADHLAWGYVDHPPLSIAFLAAIKALFGDSVHAIRLLPALLGGGLVVLTGFITREMGGGRFAQGFAALGVMISPLYLVITGYYSMNAFDLLFWGLLFFVLLRLINTQNERLWLVFGGLAGLGLMNKYSVAFLGVGLILALLFSPHRKAFKSPFFWLGGILAGVIFLPHLIWQIQAGWPSLEFMTNAANFKNADLSPLEFFLGQVVENHPQNAFIWLIGLGVLFFWPTLRPYRIIAWIYVIVFIILVVQNGKVYYLAAAYPPLLGAGAMALARFIEGRQWSWLKPVLVGSTIVGGLMIAPMGLPLLSPENFAKYQETIGLAPAPSENKEQGILPQHFADRFGWENMTQTVAEVFASLSPEEQRRTRIYTQNYGQAGAISYFGRRYQLPRVVSGHNNYFLWGYGEDDIEVVIGVGVSRRNLEQSCTTVEDAARHSSPYAMPYEANHTLYLCRGLNRPMAEIWPSVKNYD